MNSRSEKNMRENKSINIISYIFIGLLGIQAIIEFTLGGMLLFNFQATLESAFEITYTSQLDILGIALGLYLILLTTLILLSIYWTVKKNTAGPVIGVIVGVFLISFGLTVFLQLGRIDGLLIDSIRGVITVVLSLLIHKELKD